MVETSSSLHPPLPALVHDLHAHHCFLRSALCLDEETSGGQTGLPCQLKLIGRPCQACPFVTSLAVIFQRVRAQTGLSCHVCAAVPPRNKPEAGCCVGGGGRCLLLLRLPTHPPLPFLPLFSFTLAVDFILYGSLAGDWRKSFTILCELMLPYREEQVEECVHQAMALLLTILQYTRHGVCVRACARARVSDSYVLDTARALAAECGPGAGSAVYMRIMQTPPLPHKCSN